jgi:tetratricopeptide (TPR) repeat protein
MTKRFIIIVFVAVFLIQGSIYAGTTVKKDVPKKIVKLMKKGLKYFNKGVKAEKQEKKESYFNDATEKYNEVLKIDAKYAPAYFQLALICNAKKNTDNAIKYLLKTVELAPANIQAQTYLAKLYYQKAKFYQQKRDMKKTVEFYQKFVDMKIVKEKMPEKYSITVYLLGYFNSGLKNYNKAIDCFKKHIALFKDGQKTQTYYFAVYMVGFNRFTIMENQISDKGLTKDVKKLKEFVGDYSDIEKYFTETISAPQAKWTESAYFNLVKFYIYKGDKVKAKATAEELIKKYPQSKDIEIYKGLLNNQIEKLK